LEDNIKKDDTNGGGEEKKKFPVKLVIIIAAALVLCAAIVLVGIFVVAPRLRVSGAARLAEGGDLAAAYEQYDRMDLEEALERKLALQQQVIASRSTPELSFGKYEWLVLEERDGKALIITKDIISEQVYNNELTDVTWENCSLRAYLNGAFYDGFKAEEKAQVVPTLNKNTANPEYDVKNGKDTKDNVFLLSLEEANLYFADDDARAAKFGPAYGWWWLRSAGMQENLAAMVTGDGSIAYAGSGVNYGGRGVRPAMWITMS